MHKVAILADSETATGYRLAGVEVHEAVREDALGKLEALIQAGDYGLIAVDTSLLSDPSAAAARAMRGRDLPILLPVPSLEEAFSGEQTDAKAYMGKLVRDTIGFDIKL